MGLCRGRSGLGSHSPAFLGLFGETQPADGKLAHDLPPLRIGKTLGQGIALDRALPVKVRGTHERKSIYLALHLRQYSTWAVVPAAL
jgi:hypothetical protein